MPFSLFPTLKNPLARVLICQQSPPRDSEPKPWANLLFIEEFRASKLQASGLLKETRCKPSEGRTQRTTRLWQGSTILILSATNDYDWLWDSRLQESWLLQLKYLRTSNWQEARSTLHVSLFNRWSRSTPGLREFPNQHKIRLNSSRALSLELRDLAHMSPVYQWLGFTPLFRTSGVLWVLQLHSTSSG
jgi:hypothetical protein